MATVSPVESHNSSINEDGWTKVEGKKNNRKDKHRCALNPDADEFVPKSSAAPRRPPTAGSRGQFLHQQSGRLGTDEKPSFRNAGNDWGNSEGRNGAFANSGGRTDSARGVNRSKWGRDFPRPRSRNNVQAMPNELAHETTLSVQQPVAMSPKEDISSQYYPFRFLLQYARASCCVSQEGPPMPRTEQREDLVATHSSEGTMSARQSSTQSPVFITIPKSIIRNGHQRSLESVWSSSCGSPKGNKRDRRGPTDRLVRGKSESSANLREDDSISWGRAPSLPEVSMHTPSENSWIVKQQQEKTLMDDKTVERKLRGTLNKLTYDKYSILYRKLLTECGMTTLTHFTQLIEFIFEKATQQHHYIEMYADLCCNLDRDLVDMGFFDGLDVTSLVSAGSSSDLCKSMSDLEMVSSSLSPHSSKAAMERPQLNPVAEENCDDRSTERPARLSQESALHSEETAVRDNEEQENKAVDEPSAAYEETRPGEDPLCVAECSPDDSVQLSSKVESPIVNEGTSYPSADATDTGCALEADRMAEPATESPTSAPSPGTQPAEVPVLQSTKLSGHAQEARKSKAQRICRYELLHRVQNAFEKFCQNKFEPPSGIDPEDLFELEQAHKNKMKGLLRLIAILMSRKMLSAKLTRTTIVPCLAKSKDCYQLEALGTFITYVGSTLVQRKSLWYNEVIDSHVRPLVKDIDVSLRIRCLLQDSLDHHDTSYVAVKDKIVPTTLNEARSNSSRTPRLIHNTSSKDFTHLPSLGSRSMSVGERCSER